MALTLLIALGGFSRYMSVLFALANVRAATEHRLNALSLLGEAFRLDQKILISFLVALFLVWALSLLDLWRWNTRKG